MPTVKICLADEPNTLKAFHTEEKMKRSWLRSRIFLIAGLLTFHTLGNETLPNGYIENLNAAYDTPKGSAKADKVKIEDFGDYTNPVMEVENYNGLLIFSLEDQQFELDISMLGITDAKRIDVAELNFNNSDSRIELGLIGADAFDDSFQTNIRNAFINCMRDQRHSDIKDDLLSACLTHSDINIKRAYFKSEDSEFHSLIDRQEILGDAFDLDNLEIKVRNNELRAEFKSSISKGVKVKLEAETHYDLENKRVVVHLKKAKASFFNIKNTIFNALEDIDTEGLEVDRPYIYYSFE